jgi:penicillin G amidase
MRSTRFAAVGATVVGAAVVLIAALVVSTLPKRSGRLRVAGLSAPVEIVRDRHGVPSISARSLHDLFFTQGFVTAQDRLWQMEFQRRVGDGTLAEILGGKLVPADRLLRTIGFRRAAARSWEILSPDCRSEIAAYVAGVNAYLRSSSARPLEMRLMRFEPRPYDPIDALTWSKYMAWNLGGRGGGVYDEIERAELLRRFGPGADEEVLPSGGTGFPILRPEEWTPRQAGEPARGWPRSSGALPELAPFLDPLGPGSSSLGSNSWVLAGSRTSTGRPILANDPHLGLGAPPVWYLVDLRAPGFHAEGVSLPGVPGIVIGHNDRIGWGLTNIGPDVQDLYVEKLDASGERYFFDGQWRAFTHRRETIRVRGGRDVELDVRESVHGPIVAGLVSNAPAAAALRWTAIDPRVPDRGAETFFGAMRAGNWEEFRAAVSHFVAPAQNFVYADVDGHIGYTASGVVPLRSGFSGMLPTSGTGETEWTGFVAYADLPWVLDPPRGFVVTANNAVTNDPASPLSLDWPEAYRARRITEAIGERRLSPKDVAAIQLDTLSLQAREILPLLLDTAPEDDASRRLLGLLRSWNGRMSRDSAGAAAYAAWYAELARRFSQKTGAPFRTRFLKGLLSGTTRRAWCQTADTPCGKEKSQTLARAAVLLERRLGADSAAWRWDALHAARFPHAVFESVPVLRSLFSLSAPAGGDASTVDVGAYSFDGSFAMRDGPSMRQVLDFAALGESRVVIPGGESGNPFERRYRDLLPLWKDGKLFAIGEGPLTVLRLEPATR